MLNSCGKFWWQIFGGKILWNIVGGTSWVENISEHFGGNAIFDILDLGALCIFLCFGHCHHQIISFIENIWFVDTNGCNRQNVKWQMGAEKEKWQQMRF